MRDKCTDFSNAAYSLVVKTLNGYMSKKHEIRALQYDKVFHCFKI
jgi:hypothetical protein